MKTAPASSLLALAASFGSALAVSQGFNYGSTFTNGQNKQQSDFEAEFKAAQGLVGAPGSGFTSARLYTTIQGGTTNTPISAIPAAISTKTHLLLGLWASAGDAVFENEITALKNAISTYGKDFASLVDGISVGSEDLYRITPTGIENGENPGAAPDTLVKYIKEVRDTISNTVLSGALVGHVDTWTAWVNSSSSEVSKNSDWVGVDAYPYFQTTMANSIANNAELFNQALGQTKAAVGGKPIWVTETGFPVSGKTSNMAVPGLENAKTYWDQVGCPLFGSVNTWWYTLQDAQPDTPNPSFGIVGSTLSSNPLFDISCKNVAPASSSSSAASSATSSASGTATSSGASITSVPTSLGGGSPGASGPGGSQLSLETSTASASTVSGASTAPTAGSGSGSGSNGTTSGTSTPKPSSSLSTVTSGAGATLGPLGVAAAAIVGIALAL